MQIRQLSSLSSTNSMIHVLFVWSLQCAFYAAAIMRVQWRCEKQFVSLIWNHYKNQSIDFHQLCHPSRKSESHCFDSGIWMVLKMPHPQRVFLGSWIWPKYGAGFGKTQDILTGKGILQLPGKRDSPQDARFFCLYIGNSGNHIFWGQTRVNPALNCWLLSN